MEKLILVFYINISCVEKRLIGEYIEKISESLAPGDIDNNIISYFVPIENGDNRVECINPKLVSEEDYREAKQVLDRVKYGLSEYLDSIIK